MAVADDIREAVLDLTRQGMSAAAIATELGVSRSCIERWRQLLAASYLADPAFSESPTGPLVFGGKGQCYGRDPSPSQIAARAAAIRRTWTEAERRLREGDPPDGLTHRYSQAKRDVRFVG